MSLVNPTRIAMLATLGWFFNLNNLPVLGVMAC